MPADQSNNERCMKIKQDGKIYDKEYGVNLFKYAVYKGRVKVVTELLKPPSVYGNILCIYIRM